MIEVLLCRLLCAVAHVVAMAPLATPAAYRVPCWTELPMVSHLTAASAAIVFHHRRALAHVVRMPGLQADRADVVGRQAPALSGVVIVGTAAMAGIGIPTPTLAPAALCTTSSPFPFAIAFSLFSTCFAAPKSRCFASSCLSQCCQLLLESFELCDGALHGGDVGGVMA